MTVASPHGAEQVAVLLDNPEITRLISDLQEIRWTGRRGYPIRAMVGLALVKSVYAIPTWSRTVRLVGEHTALQAALGDAPSIHAAYRFTVKLREHSAALADCLDRIIAGFREVIPDLGASLAIDGSDLPATRMGCGICSTASPVITTPTGRIVGTPVCDLHPQRW
ncbi:MAG: hypothetical protein ACRDTH_15445 [Pseudonocardiaceae bacterium]